MEDKLEKLKKKNDLSDIILEKDGSSGDKIKKILLAAASLVLLFLIILIGMKMFNNSNVSPSENLASAEDMIEQTTDTIVDTAKETIDDTTEDPLFKSEAIIDETTETDLKFEEMVRKLKQQDALENKKAEASTETTETDLNKELNVADKSKENVVDKIKEVAVTPIQKAEVTVKEVVKPTIVEPKTVKPVVKPKPIIKSEPVVVETKPKKVYTPTPSQISPLSGYFIQVGATAKSFPDRRFLQKIKNSGYDYIVHKVVVKGKDIKKVLIGPYGTRDQARSELSRVQSSINPSAYIYRIK